MDPQVAEACAPAYLDNSCNLANRCGRSCRHDSSRAPPDGGKSPRLYSEGNQDDGMDQASVGGMPVSTA